MDIIITEEEISLPQVALYASVSFLIVSILGAILYITCSKKYRLNWFEKSLLEAAKDSEDIRESREALVGSGIPYNVDNVSECSRSIGKGNLTPTSINDDPTFWVPPKTTTGNANQNSSAEESTPATPSSPTESTRSMTLSMCSGTIPIARSDKQMVLAMNPVKPKVTSMHAKLDPTKIDTSLYQGNEPTSPPPTNENLRGNIHLWIWYDPVAGNLTIRLIEAQELQPRDFSGTADPYAKIRLLPDKKNVWQTRIHKKTLNPIFDEDFVFEEHPTQIGKRTLEILLYDFDAYSRHLCIGGTQILLEKLDLSERVDIWKQLGVVAEQDAKIDLGDLMVSLSYLQSAERLTVVVIKARNLRVIDDSRNSSDPYVKVSLINNGKKIKKRKTGVIRNNVAPVFNEALTFDVSKDVLKSSFLEFIVLHDSLLGSNEILGKTVLGHSSEIRLEERTFFDEMFRSKTAIAQWLPLYEHNVKIISTHHHSHHHHHHQK
ncbi:synaptotagmin-B [Condylostylus longicornis]|uniref:synaptotagmin-B n=1 Tax=Condylostylus longicornis TaxID=2530218 RepID=UPI00244E3C61|nr:synaptotagmin-B [Condylostylus longicornis]